MEQLGTVLSQKFETRTNQKSRVMGLKPLTWSSIMDFEISSAENGITLCPTCHSAFDNYTAPGFIFVPTDLQFFISYEQRDQRRRRRATQPLPRRYPNSRQYLDHQIRNGDVEAGAVGGLYFRCILF